MPQFVPNYETGYWSPAIGNLWGRPRYPQLWDGCVGSWYPGLGIQGNKLFDNSAYSDSVTAVNYAANIWSSGPFGSVVRVSSTYFKTSSTYNLVSRGVSSATFSAWLRTTDSIAAILDSDGWGPFQFRVSNGKLELYSRYNNHLVTSATSVNTGQLLHLAATHNHATGQKVAYINGRSDASSTSSAGAISSYPNGPLRIAESGWGGLQLDGDLYEASIYNRVLSQSELSTLAQRPGIMYEMEPSRMWAEAAAATTANRRRRLLLAC